MDAPATPFSELLDFGESDHHLSLTCACVPAGTT